MNVLPTKRVTLQGVVDPEDLAAGTTTSAWVDMAKFGNLMAMVAVGTMGSTGTVDAKLEQATDSSGTGAKDVTGKAITQLTEAGSDDDKQVFINCRHQDLDYDNSFAFVRLSVTTAVASSPVFGAVFGLDARSMPEDDLASVDEVV